MNVTTENVQEHILGSRENVALPERSEKPSWTMCYAAESGRKRKQLFGELQGMDSGSSTYRIGEAGNSAWHSGSCKMRGSLAEEKEPGLAPCQNWVQGKWLHLSVPISSFKSGNFNTVVAEIT